MHAHGLTEVLATPTSNRHPLVLFGFLFMLFVYSLFFYFYATHAHELALPGAGGGGVVPMGSVSMCRRMFVHKILPANPSVAFAGNLGMQQSAAEAYGAGRQEAARLAPWKEEAGAREREAAAAQGGLVRIPPS